ncbi:MAG: hypothetical protein HXX16_04145 [Bacteroidales bacterium]|nr:hypothetical protein [Bacteroidales bacterium]
MAYRKRGTSPEHDKAKNRLSGMKLTEQTIDFGPGLTEADYANKIQEVERLMVSYNALLTQADSVATRLDSAEKELAELSMRFLNAIGAKYGFDSTQYENAGGIRTSDYKRSSKKVAHKSVANQQN